MPPKLRIRSLAQLTDLKPQRTTWICQQCSSYATAVTPSPSEAQFSSSMPPISRYSSVQPPSHRDPKYRKSQLIRSYVSLLQTTPLIILFQHNNLRASEWVGIRRELATAMRKMDDDLLVAGADPSKAEGEHVRISVVQTNMFEPALRIAEYYNPAPAPAGGQELSQGSNRTIESEKDDPALTHVLSRSAYTNTQRHKDKHDLSPLLSGNIALLSFPSVSPAYVKAALSILAPKAPNFPAPTRKAKPSYHEPAVQDGLKKLMLLGARIDGKVFDNEGTRWVGSIDGGLDGLRAQLVWLLQGFGAGVTTALESAGRNVWFTMESRRKMLEEASDGANGKDQVAKAE